MNPTPNPDLLRLPTTDPAQILRYRDRQYAAELIAALLLHFDFFTWIHDRRKVSTDEIRGNFGFAARPTDVLLTLCRANGFLVSIGDEHELTILGREHLVAGSPWFLGPYYTPIKDTPIVEGFIRVLRSGKPASWQARTDTEDWHDAMLSEDFANSFTQLMNCRGMAFGQAMAHSLAPFIGDRRTLLDVGGGSGIYASTMVAAHPQLKAIVLEQPPVDRIAQIEIRKHGLEESIRVMPGDMFETPWPAGQDIVLLSNVLHDWDFPEVRALIALAAAALAPGGLLIIHEAFLDNDKSGPLPVAEYSALLMNITQGKCYTPHEYGQILEENGLRVGPFHKTIADRGYMTATKP
jgi:SAM-dependent methyltransferase